MSVDPAICTTVLKADGSAKSFDFEFRQFIKPNTKHTVKVTTLDSTGKYSSFTENVEYTVSWKPQGGTVLFNTAPAANVFVIMESDVEYTQHYKFETGQHIDGFVLTNALDELNQKIIQCCCKASNAAQIARDPVTGQLAKIVFAGALAKDKLLETNDKGEVISSSFSKQDLVDLGTATQLASQNAQTAANTATQAKTDAQNAATQANQAKQAVDTTNTQFQTDAAAVRQDIATGKSQIGALVTTGQQTAQTIATDKAAVDAAKSAVQTSETNINNLYNTNIKPVSDLVKAPVSPDELLVGGNGAWTKSAGLDFLKKLFKQIAGDGQLVWNDGGTVTGIDKSSLGGGGNVGSGVDLKAVFDGQAAGSALIADPGATDKYSLQLVPAIKTPDPTKDGQAVIYGSGGTIFTSAVVPLIVTPNPANTGKLLGYGSGGASFVPTDPPDLQGKGADYTVPTTIASAPNKLKQLEAMVADPDATDGRDGKMGRINGAHVDYVYMPPGEKLIVVDKADATDTVDLGVTIPAGQAVETFKNLQLHFDVANDKWEILLGDNAMGGSTIPTPPGTPMSYLGDEKLANGVGMKWDPLNFERPTSAADDGKVWVWNQAQQKYVLEAPMTDTPLTRSLTGETGISGAPEITKTAALTINIEPCILQFSDPITYATISHDLPQTTYVLTGVTNTIVWVYSDPKDGWKIKQQTTTPTLDERLGRVYLAEVEVTNSIIRSVKPIYNELSHKEYVLREIGDAIGTTTRGAKFDIVANGLKAVKDATLFSFLARRVPLTGGGVFNSSKLFFTKDAIYNAYYVKNGVVDNTASTTFLPKIYIDATGNEGTLATGNSAVTVHYVYAPATFDTATGNITGLYLIIGNSLYDSISSAKEDIMTADSAAEVPAFISRNCALVAKIFVRYDAVDTNPATFAIINYANLSSKSTSVIHSSVLPDTSGVVDGAILQVKSGNYMFDSNVRPLVADTPIADGQILTVQGGKAVGVDPSTLGSGTQNTDKKLKFEYVFINPNDFATAVTITNPNSKIEASAKITSIERKAGTADGNIANFDGFIITLTEKLTFFDRVIVYHETGDDVRFYPVFTSNTDPSKIRIELTQIPAFKPPVLTTERFKFIIYYF